MELEANRDTANSMSKCSNPDQLEGDPALTVKGVMRPVMTKKAASMGLTRTGDNAGKKTPE